MGGAVHGDQGGGGDRQPADDGEAGVRRDEGLDPGEAGGAGGAAGRATAQGRGVLRAGSAQQQRGEQAGEAGVDLGELEVDRGSGTAVGQVVVDALGVATGEPAPDVGAEVVARPGAVDV